MKREFRLNDWSSCRNFRSTPNFIYLVMSNFRNLAGKPDKWDQSFQDLSSDNHQFRYGRSKGKRGCISSRKFLQCSFFGELLFCSSQRRRGKSKLMCITVVQWSRSCLNVQINRVRLPSTLFSVSLYRFWPLFLKLFFFLAFFLYSYCWPCWSWTWINPKLRPPKRSVLN